jgi:hypothetical protein
MNELTIQRETNLPDIKLLKILNTTKKAVQMGNSDQLLNNGFVHAVKIDEEIYVVHIEKYVSAESDIALLTKMQL